MTPVRIPVEQRTPAWLAARRELITGTDIPALLGLSPWRSEADVAADKAGADAVAETVRMRIGSALEPLILGELARTTGREYRRVRAMYRHGRIEWAAASPDALTARKPRRLAELKWSGSRSRWADGLPQDVEAQVRWQMGVMDVPVADVAALVGDELLTFELEHDPALFDGMVAIAEDFRRRLAAGGPFAHNSDSVRRAYPADDGSEAVADDEVAAAVARLQEIRSEIDRLERNEDALKVAIQTRMGEHAVLHTPGFDVIWRRSKDGTTTDWKAVVDELIGSLAGTERDALLGRHTTVRPGMRPFRVVAAKEGR